MSVRSTKYNAPSGFSDIENRALKDSAIHTNAIRSKFGKILATGGDIERLEPGNGYVYHTFTSSGTFSVLDPSLGSIEILLVAAGGQGGGPMGGGGGAGGLLYGPYPVTAGNYSVVIASSTLGTLDPTSGRGLNGSNSEFFPTPVAPNPAAPTRATALGGGGGSSYLYAYPGYGGNPGGSGGGVGGGYPSAPGAALTPTKTQNPSAGLTGYGNNGGTGSPGPYAASGGGGSGTAGSPANLPSSTGGPGGQGRQYSQFAGNLIGLPQLTPFAGYYAAGGGGGGYPTVGPGDPMFNQTPTQDFSYRTNNIGGAGHNNIDPTTPPYGYGPGSGPTAPALLIERVYGTDYTGSGGGGGSYSYGQPGRGGSGICCIRYLKQT